MKKLFFAAALIAVAATVCGQNISANEIIDKSNCRTFTCFGHFISRNGYSYKENSTSGKTTYYIYSSNEYFKPSNGMDLQLCNVAKIGIERTKTYIGMRTVNQVYYLQLLTEFEKMGFTVVSTQNSNTVSTVSKITELSNVTVYYKSPKYPKLFLRVISENDTYEGYKKTFTSYEIGLTRLY